MEKNFETQTFGKRLNSMWRVDARRMFTSPLFYIMVGISFVVPILILVMTTMMASSAPSVPNAEQAAMGSFENVWQILGSISSATNGEGAGMSMDLVGMCNINMMYFAVAVLVCIFVADDFRSGYAKNLFTVRAKKTDYVLSKTLVCFIGGAAMILAFFVGAILGGSIAKLPFSMEGFNFANLLFCILSKMILVLIFVPIYLCMSVIAKQKLWLSMLLSFGVGMFLFNIAPMVSPLNSTALHIVLCFAGGAMFAVGLGAISNQILQKTSLI